MERACALPAAFLLPPTLAEVMAEVEVVSLSNLGPLCSKELDMWMLSRMQDSQISLSKSPWEEQKEKEKGEIEMVDLLFDSLKMRDWLIHTLPILIQIYLYTHLWMDLAITFTSQTLNRTDGLYIAHPTNIPVATLICYSWHTLACIH